MHVDVEELRTVLQEAAQPGAAEVCALLPDLCPTLFAPGSDIETLRLKSRVFRVQSVRDGARTSVVLKRLNPAVAEHNERLVKRWLPGIGLPDAAPALVGTIGDQRGTCVWHVYEDLGDTVLDGVRPRRREVAAALELIAELHIRAATHPLLLECHQLLGNRGMQYFVSNVGDAVGALEALRALEKTFTSGQRLVLNRLLDRLHALRDSIPLRAQLMAERGGPQTLLHGDLWPINTFVIPSAEGMQARLIDWDRAGVGPVVYDLSTFLYRFPPNERPWILEHYRGLVGRIGWYLPEASELNLLFETAECARYANRIIWSTITLLTEHAESGHRELADIQGWFEMMEPALDAQEIGE
jgi:hypothetical protein